MIQLIKEGETPLVQWALVSLLQPQNWRDDVLSRAGGAIADVCLFDLRRVVHCAELTPSYELELVQSLAWEDATGELGIELTTAWSDDPILYVHVRSIDQLRQRQPGAFHIWEPEALCLEDGETTEEAWERTQQQMMEKVRANCYLEFPAGFSPRRAA